MASSVAVTFAEAVLRPWTSRGCPGRVVRVLAEDVVCRLEEVLDTILAAVVFCRQPAHR